MQSEANVDAPEIEKFDALAHRWWDPNGDFKPLHDINPARLDYIRQRTDLSTGQTVDIGCGGGILSESMAASGADTLGVDMAGKALGVAKLHALETGVDVKYQETTAEQLAETRAGGFRTVTCMEMLEHVTAYPDTVQACAELAQPGGEVVHPVRPLEGAQQRVKLRDRAAADRRLWQQVLVRARRREHPRVERLAPEAPLVEGDVRALLRDQQQRARQLGADDVGAREVDRAHEVVLGVEEQRRHRDVGAHRHRVVRGEVLVGAGLPCRLQQGELFPCISAGPIRKAHLRAPPRLLLSDMRAR